LSSVDLPFFPLSFPLSSWRGTWEEERRGGPHPFPHSFCRTGAGSGSFFFPPFSPPFQTDRLSDSPPSHERLRGRPQGDRPLSLFLFSFLLLPPPWTTCGNRSETTFPPPFFLPRRDRIKDVSPSSALWVFSLPFCLCTGCFYFVCVG